MVSKQTVDELLELYLEQKGFSGGLRNDIKKALHLGITKVGDRERKKEIVKLKKERVALKKAEEQYGKSRISHGTSCPRIITPDNDLIIEM